MKQPYAFIVVMAVLTASCSTRQAKNTYIKSIETSEQIKELMFFIDSVSYRDFHIPDSLNYHADVSKRIADSLSQKPWYKGDFDNNGYPDLLVNAENAEEQEIIAILDNGNNTYNVYFLLPHLSRDDWFFTAIRVQSHNVILRHRLEHRVEYGEGLESKNMPPGVIPFLRTDTLVYKWNSFIEYHSDIKKHTIEKIEFETSGCYGRCPIFELEINSDRSAVYNAKNFNVIEGKHEGVVEKNTYNEIIALLNDIDFPNLKDKYNVGWTDDQTVKLKIVYDNGKVKMIEDYGLQGTPGLTLLYTKMFALRGSQKWEKVE